MTWTEEIPLTDLRTKRMASLDVAKFVLSLLVIASHINPFEHFGLYWSYGMKYYFVRLTVTIFILSSSLFCFRKTSEDAFDFQVPLQYALKLLKLYVLWTALYIPRILFDCLEYPEGFLPGLLRSVQEIFVSGYYHLWYLKSMAIAILLVGAALAKKVKVETLVIVGCLLYLVGQLADAYYGVLDYVPFLKPLVDGYLKVFFTSRNGIFMAFPYVAIGALFAYRPITIRMPAAVLGYLGFKLLMLGEFFLLLKLKFPRDYCLFTCSIPASFFLFYIMLHTQIKATPLTKKLRTYTGLIYYVHPYVIFPVLPLFIKVIELVLGVEEYEMHSMWQFVFVAIVTMIVSWLIPILQKHRLFRWLKALY